MGRGRVGERSGQVSRKRRSGKSVSRKRSENRVRRRRRRRRRSGRKESRKSKLPVSEHANASTY